MSLLWGFEKIDWEYCRVTRRTALTRKIHQFSTVSTTTLIKVIYINDTKIKKLPSHQKKVIITYEQISETPENRRLRQSLLAPAENQKKSAWDMSSDISMQTVLCLLIFCKKNNTCSNWQLWWWSTTLKTQVPSATGDATMAISLIRTRSYSGSWMKCRKPLTARRTATITSVARNVCFYNRGKIFDCSCMWRKWPLGLCHRVIQSTVNTRGKYITSSSYNEEQPCRDIISRHVRSRSNHFTKVNVNMHRMGCMICSLPLLYRCLKTIEFLAWRDIN